MIRFAFGLILILLFSCPVQGLERPDKEFKIFQFPSNMIPRIDGETDDWAMVPDEYAIGTDELKDTVKITPIDKKDLNVSVKIGWVKGMDKLYFLYEAYDDYWEFDKPGSMNDIFELVVDADLSGGALIPDLRGDKVLSQSDGYFRFHGIHAQNYHINTPALGKSWAMVWGCQPWIAHLPWANAVYKYNFKQGESGKLVLEFMITPFDFAPYEGPERAVISRLEENKIIAMSWAILDQDGHQGGYDGFYNISHKTTMYGNASDFVAFRLMPLEKRFHRPLESNFTFTVVDMDRKLIAFKDLSYGNITKWLWDFGDGATSTDRNPMHQYQKPGYYYVVNLTVEGPEGKDRLSIPWDAAAR
jgi:hypothetical protein